MSFFNFGFSYIGVIWLLILCVPNIIWLKFKPDGYDTVNESKGLSVCERVGQVGTTATAVVFSDFNVNSSGIWGVWLILSAFLMFLYICWWARYFAGEKTLKNFYSSFLGVPVAGATLPVVAFFLLGVYGLNIFMLIFSTILGVGHIGIHLQHRKEIKCSD